MSGLVFRSTDIDIAAQVMVTKICEVLTSFSSELLGTWIHELGQIFVDDAASKWDILLDESRRKSLTNIAAWAVEALSSSCWTTLLMEDTVAQEIKASLQCLQSATQFILEGMFYQVIAGQTSDISSSSLSRLVALGDLSDMKAFVNRKESQGHTVLVAEYSRLRVFVNSVMQPNLVAALDAQSSVPMEKLKVHWHAAVAALRVVERSVTNGDTPAEEELLTALKDASVIDAKLDLEVVSGAASSRLQSQRSQVLHRVISAATLIGSTWSSFLQVDLTPIAERVVDSLSKLEHEGAALQAWIEGNKDKFDDIGKEWFACAFECVRLRTLLSDLVARGKDCFDIFSIVPRIGLLIYIGAEVHGQSKLSYS